MVENSKNKMSNIENLIWRKQEYKKQFRKMKTKY